MWNPFRKKKPKPSIYIPVHRDLPQMTTDLMNHSPRARSEALEVTWKARMDPLQIPEWLLRRLIITNDGFPWFVKKNGQVERVKIGQTFKYCRGDIKVYED